MSNQNIDQSTAKNLKIEGDLPIRTVGIETERERRNFTHLPPQNYMHVWWARRPTPATRLAVLSSVLPDTVEDDTLLKWLGIDPDNKSSDTSIAEHVRLKDRTRKSTDGPVYEHYGYRKVWTQTPDKKKLNEIHGLVKDTWDGELPTVLDATAGGGSIPFESVRYGLPTIANELNPVASVLLKGVLEHPRVNGDLSDDIRSWGDQIHEIASEQLQEYFPAANEREETVNYLWSHEISCPDCGTEIPLAPNWWVEKENASEGTAVRPEMDDGEVTFELVDLPEDVTKEQYNPTEGSVSYGKATCLNCSVTIDAEEIREQAREDEMGYRLFCVEYRDLRSDSRGNYRIPREKDREAFRKAEEKVRNSPELASLLNEPIPDMHEKYDTTRWGITEWRDMFSPRQLLSHYEYWKAFEEVKPQIYSEYSEPEAEAILTFLSFVADKALDYNCRLCMWDSTVPKVAHLFSRHDFAFAWSFAEINLTSDDTGYEWMLGNVLKAYDDLVDLSSDSEAPVDVYQGDAADLPLESESVEAAVVDPPYYDNVMYSELSDFFYVWMKRYLGDVYPDFFTNELTEKDEEAVAKEHKFEGVASDESTKGQLAKEDYEGKMTEIFDEIHRVLNRDGVFTLMFTHKKTEAWDTLTESLINSGFIVKASHPVGTENPHSLHQAGKNAAESTILLVSEKREEGESESFTLWEDIKDKTREVARQKVSTLDDLEVEFTKVDMILASFGPTLEVFTEHYPVVDDEGNEVNPQQALDEARAAVRDYLIEEYLNQGVKNVDAKTEWYILAWLVFEAKRFPYDEARRLAIGVGEELDTLKKSHRMWRKRSGDVLLRPHEDRVQDVTKDKDNRSSRIPVDPDALSFTTSLDKVHAAMHIYDVQGSTEAWNWMNDRNCESDPRFKATLEALLRVLPHEHDDWELARDLAAGETGELLDLDLDADIFRDENENDNEYQGNLDDF